MDYSKIVHEVVDSYKNTPINMLGNEGTGDGEYEYLSTLRDSYVRTVQDVDLLFNDRKGKKVLEVGAFLGPVSITLKGMGYDVSATEIPEFHESNSLVELYKKYDIPFHSINLKNHELPFESNSFDVVVICEVIEHLNFNPLLILKELNRILKKGGYLYIGMPNQAYILNRIKLLAGKSIHNKIDDYFKQFDRNCNMIVGLHWREYTLVETKELTGRMGFNSINEYYYYDKNTSLNGFKKLLFKLLCLIPSFRPFQVVIAKKVAEPEHDFWLTDANS
ncbi:class I SAM-dependent methyltransferase [Psychromonas ossibalaenae]|uniref:class I SAM-dependent methyltransferase n=1 Tax=Psychromonas ossibalaenae TaxID=444922 RepID=UPI00036C9C6E|nr:class I SAM-dependent methyltransferase [Psychromonas ossibalaenae]